MLRLVRVAASAALLLSLQVSQALPLPPPATGKNDEQPAVTSSSATQPPAPAALSSKPLQERSRLEILRSVDGEFARVLTSLPASKKGFHMKAGQPLDQNALRKAIGASGAGVNPGDSAQITRLEFLPRGILLDLNGGGRVRRSWKDHLQLEVGLAAPVMAGSSGTSDGPLVAAAKKTGATLYLDFNRTLPDMNSGLLKQYLAAVLDFTKQRSAAVQWVETLPPKFQQAISDKRAEIGMDRDEVAAALGRPDRKVREWDSDGKEIEDWIYGSPPAPTTFVKFSGETVGEIHRYPDPLKDSTAQATAER